MRISLLILLTVTIGLAQNNRAAETNVVTLSQCFKEVLANNDELLRLRKDVERAAGTRLEIRSRELPQLSTEPSAGLRNGSLYGHNGVFALVTAEFSQPVFNTGIPASWRRGELEVLAAEQRLNLAISDRLQETRFFYLRLQRLRQVIALYEELDKRLQSNVTREEQRRDVGTGGPRPVLQARVQMLAAGADLTAFRREEYELQTRLGELMGRSVNQLPSVTEALAYQPVGLDLKELSRTALQRRADLKFLRTLIQITIEDRRVVDAGYFPFVSLVGSALYLPGKKLVYQATPIIEGQTPLATEGRYGGSLTWQIVDNGQVTGVSRRVEGIQHEYEISLRQLEQSIPRELVRVSHALEDSETRLAALNKAVKEAGEDLSLIETRISLGEATQLDFSDAQRNLLAVQHGVVDVLFQRDWALAELDGITGGYLEFAEPVKAR